MMLGGVAMRRVEVSEKQGHDDYTAGTVEGRPSRLISAVAMEFLREAATRARAPKNLLGHSDEELLQAIGVIRDGRLTQAGLLLGGSRSAIREHVPHHAWTHARMSSETDCSDRIDGQDAIPAALWRIMDRIMGNNPIETVRSGLYHFEYRRYPKTALREALLNAFCHSDYRVAGPRIVRQYADRIEISNPGGLVGGLTPENILRPPPMSRNPCLVHALVKLRLINPLKPGVRRMYGSFIMEGKLPPVIEHSKNSVTLTFRASKLRPAFRAFVTEEATSGRILGLDELLILHRLLDHPKIDAADAARLCQRPRLEAEAVLSSMELDRGYLIRRDDEPGTAWGLSSETLGKAAPLERPEPFSFIDPEQEKARVLSAIRDRTARGMGGLANADIRHLTARDRYGAHRLIRELLEDGCVRIVGRGRGSRYVYVDGGPAASLREMARSHV